MYDPARNARVAFASAPAVSGSLSGSSLVAVLKRASGVVLFLPCDCVTGLGIKAPGPGTGHGSVPLENDPRITPGLGTGHGSLPGAVGLWAPCG